MHPLMQVVDIMVLYKIIIVTLMLIVCLPDCQMKCGEEKINSNARIKGLVLNQFFGNIGEISLLQKFQSSIAIMWHFYTNLGSLKNELMHHYS